MHLFYKNLLSAERFNVSVSAPPLVCVAALYVIINGDDSSSTVRDT